MKIEIKPFNDRVRFASLITFKRFKMRTNVTKGGSLFFGHCPRRKNSANAGLF